METLNLKDVPKHMLTGINRHINISRYVPQPVIEPEKLKNMVKADLKKALAQYEGTVHAYLRPQARKGQSNYIG